MKAKHVLTLTAAIATYSSQVHSNDFNLGLEFKTNHLWHGSIVTPGPMVAGELTYKTADNKITLGLWGGTSFDGEYQEFTYFASYKFSEQLFIEIVNHGNHSSINNVDIFDYSSDPDKTGNFIDVGLGYTFAGEMPLSLYNSVIVQGIDTYLDESSGKNKQAYTNYLEASMPVWKGNELDEQVSVFIGGAFSFLDQQNFYDDIANIVNLGFTYSKSLQILEYNFPISATAMWNPAQNKGALQVTFTFL